MGEEELALTASLGQAERAGTQVCKVVTPQVSDAVVAAVVVTPLAGMAGLDSFDCIGGKLQYKNGFYYARFSAKKRSAVRSSVFGEIQCPQGFIPHRGSGLGCAAIQHSRFLLAERIHQKFWRELAATILMTLLLLFGADTTTIM
jgi:hypothetical protein